jgi:hypothetical protein
MKSAAEDCRKSLKFWNPDYVFVFKTLAEFYTYAQAVFVPLLTGILIQVMWPIVQSSSPRYELMHVRSLYVPVSTSPSFDSREAYHDFTKIDLPYPYLAVANNRHFIELNNDMLEKCSRIGQTYYCYEIFLELDNIHLTCLTFLYLNESARIVNENCEVTYYFEPFVPPPEC